jgi:hypothetical protein
MPMNPEDERYKNHLGKKYLVVLIPLVSLGFSFFFCPTSLARKDAAESIPFWRFLFCWVSTDGRAMRVHVRWYEATCAPATNKQCHDRIVYSVAHHNILDCLDRKVNE